VLRKILVIEIQDIDVFYKNIHALKKVSIAVQKGEIIGLVGGNGAGKSTMIKSITGLVRKRAGKIFFKGKEITHLDPASICRLGVSTVPEGRRLFGPMTVEDNLNLGAYLRFKTEKRKEIQKDMNEIFGLFPRLKERIKQTAGTLSGGEQQMLAIARALMGRPKAILMDEPSTGLAPLIVKEIFGTIKRLKKEGNTVLLIEQNARMALKISDYAYVMESGQIVLKGKAEDLLEDESVKRSYLGV
jgi:branched-chain amino acid transport system ATP-binding protein